MYPQTHVYFAESVLGMINETIALGSIFPDMAIGAGVNRHVSHTCGLDIFNYFKFRDDLDNFARGSITHGITPFGLDYYGDEKLIPFERGYCFEKARGLVEETVKACGIPAEMGWWKAHNIIEMGIEIRVGATGKYGEILASAFSNKKLVEKISSRAGEYFKLGKQPFVSHISSFPAYIDLGVPTAQSMAEKYDYQMYKKHGIHINIAAVSRLIDAAAEKVAGDIDSFFSEVRLKVKEIIP